MNGDILPLKTGSEVNCRHRAGCRKPNERAGRLLAAQHSPAHRHRFWKASRPKPAQRPEWSGRRAVRCWETTRAGLPMRCASQKMRMWRSLLSERTRDRMEWMSTKIRHTDGEGHDVASLDLSWRSGGSCPGRIRDRNTHGRRSGERQTVIYPLDRGACARDCRSMAARRARRPSRCGCPVR